MAQDPIQQVTQFNRQAICKLPYNIKPGDTHAGVCEVKRYLKHYDYAESQTFSINDDFDEETRVALLKFQSWFNLKPTGTLDGPTKAALTQPRCAHSRANPLAANVISKWDKKDLTYAWGPLSNDISEDECKAAVVRAFATWQEAGVGLTFAEVALDGNPDLYVDWRDARDPDLLRIDSQGMVGGTLAHADFPGAASIIVKNGKPPLPIHFDDEEHVWVDGAFPNGFDIETVALHEIGHTLGLLHSNDHNAIMAPTVADNATKRRLQLDDLNGIRRLYGET